MTETLSSNTHKQHTEPSQPVDRNVWDRWQLIWNSAFVGLLLLSVMLSLFSDYDSSNLVVMFILVAIFSAWYAGHAYLMVRFQQSNSIYRFAYMTIGMLLWFAMAGVDPTFIFMLALMYPSLFLALTLRWAMVGVVLLGILLLFRLGIYQSEFLPEWIGFISFSTVISVTLGIYITEIINQSQKRQALIDELALTREALANERHRSGVLEERQRLAGEIHDTLAQGLTSIITLLEASENAPTESPNATHYRLQAKQTARHNLEEARRFVHDLQPQLLDNQSLPAALQRLADRVSAENTFNVHFTITGTPSQLHPAIEVVALRITQEALTNVSKHANASHVNITLSYLGQQIILDIQDDGDGFVEDQRKLTGEFGLIGMRRRIDSIGGNFTLESTPDDGTTIAAELPLKPVQ